VTIGGRIADRIFGSEPVAARLGRQRPSHQTFIGVAGLLVVLALAACSATSATASPTHGVSPTPSPTRAPTPTASATLAPSFASTGSTVTPRVFCTATLLTDGRVLVAGGLGYDKSYGGFLPSIASAELYDPKTGMFTSTGSMTAARASATATRLADGRVLIAGGFVRRAAGTPDQTLYSAELYDPTTGKFSPTGSMTGASQVPAGALLPDGRVLIGETGSAELYDPTTGRFTRTGSMTTADRGGYTSVALADGRVLFIGGVRSGFNGPDDSAELYDPKTGTFRATGSMGAGRWDETATLLSDGRVLIAGGWVPNDTSGSRVEQALATAELYDPTTGTFTPTGPMKDARFYQSATLLPADNGRVLIAGGEQGLGNYNTHSLDSAELYDPTTGTFSFALSMTTPRGRPAAVLLPDGRVLVIGSNGSPAGQPVTSAELFRP
jgi:hypothetical protein